MTSSTVVLAPVPEEGDTVASRASFLAQASHLLAASLDYEVTLDSVARLMVPAVADYCVIDLVDEEGAVRRLGTAHEDRDQELLLKTKEFYVDLSSDEPTARAIRSGLPLLIPEVTEQFMTSAARSEAHLDLIRALQARSIMVVPLIARGATIGTLSLARVRSHNSYGPADLALAQDLAARAALAVDNARLYEQAGQATRLRDEVLAIVSHDLRNPLGVIALSASALSDDVLPREQQLEVLGIIQRTTERMDALIRDLLDITRMEAGKLEVHRSPDSAVALLTETLDAHRLLGAEKGVHLDMDVPEYLPPVSVDRERILQVLGNLVGNAIKFTPAGGRVLFAAEWHGGQTVRFTVRDTGIGIPERDLTHLFDRYWQARAHARTGAGLGLAISKGIVEAHGGEFEVRSTAGEGSCFAFTVPVDMSQGADVERGVERDTLMSCPPG